MGDPGRLYSGELSLVLLAVFLFPTMTVGVLAFRYAKGGARLDGR